MSHFTDREPNRKRLQLALIEAGKLASPPYDCGPSGADGKLGNDTAKAVDRYRRDHNLGSGAVIDNHLLSSLNLTPETIRMNTSNNWLSALVASTAGKYIVAMIATFIASKIGVDHGSIEGILTQLIGVAAGVWGMWESSKSKVVVNGEKVNVKDLSATDKATVANIVAKSN